MPTKVKQYRTHDGRFLGVVLSALVLILAAGCDRFAVVEINNDSAFDVRVRVNDESFVLNVPAGGRDYAGPGVNERLRSLEIILASNPSEREVIEFDTYDDDIVLHVKGPPLEVSVSHQDHPSATSTAPRTRATAE